MRLDATTLVVKKPSGVFRNHYAEIADGRYSVKLAETTSEVESALRLRYEVFIANRKTADNFARLEFDEYDFTCKHLIVIERSTQKTIGTYRLSSIESARNSRGFYSFNEFTIEKLPQDVLYNGIEIGRACIASEHRNTKVLFLLWKALANYMKQTQKRFFFGCCSIFTQDPIVGARAFRQLERGGYLHESFQVEPRKNAVGLDESRHGDGDEVELPALFNMYLRIGAKICGPPMIDHEFGTIDFFVIFDALRINEKYRKMFFG